MLTARTVSIPHVSSQTHIDISDPTTYLTGSPTFNGASKPISGFRRTICAFYFRNTEGGYTRLRRRPGQVRTSSSRPQCLAYTRESSGDLYQRVVPTSVCYTPHSQTLRLTTSSSAGWSQKRVTASLWRCSTAPCVYLAWTFHPRRLNVL